jgi:hypothetical protein
VTVTTCTKVLTPRNGGLPRQAKTEIQMACPRSHRVLPARNTPVRASELARLDPPGPVRGLWRAGAGRPVLRRRVVRLRGRGRDDSRWPIWSPGSEPDHRRSSASHRRFGFPGPRCPRPGRRRGLTQR